MVHIYNEILLSLKMNEIMPFATWMDLEMIIEVNQKDKDTYHLISLLCRI